MPDEDINEAVRLAEFYHQHTPNHIEIFWLRYFPKAEITAWAFRNNYISWKFITDIEDGCLVRGIIQEDKNTAKNIKKVIFFLYLFPFLSFKMRDRILRKRFYLFFPYFVPGLFLYVLSRIFNRPRFDLNTDRTIRRYLYFILRGYKTKS